MDVVTYPQTNFYGNVFVEEVRLYKTIRLWNNILYYAQTSKIMHTLVDNKIVDHSDVVGAFGLALDTWLQWIG